LLFASRRRMRENERFAMSGEQCALQSLWYTDVLIDGVSNCKVPGETSCA
jgi:hypothetical protein